MEGLRHSHNLVCIILNKDAQDNPIMNQPLALFQVIKVRQENARNYKQRHRQNLILTIVHYFTHMLGCSFDSFSSLTSFFDWISHIEMTMYNPALNKN